MRVAYLFNRTRVGEPEMVRCGALHDNSFYGMFRLEKYGVDAEHLELEQYFSKQISLLMRKVGGVYFQHVPLFWELLSYDVVFASNAFGAQFIHTLFRLRTPAWVMYDFSLSGLLNKYPGVKGKILHWLISRAAGIITISEYEEKKMRTLFPHMKDRVSYIPLGVDTKFFSPRENAEKNYIFAPGFDPCRDYETLFEAASGMDTSVVVSKSRQMDKLESIPSFVQKKQLSTEELLQTYGEAKVIVVPLDISGGINDAAGSTTVVEAMAMGKAVIATKTPTLESYIEDGVTGVLVPPRNPIALRQALEQVLSDSVLRERLGKAAREYVVRECEADKTAKKLIQFFSGISEPKIAR